MQRVRRLTIIVAGDEAERFRAGLEVAAAAAAVGRPVRMFLQGGAVRLLARPMASSGDAGQRLVGQPRLAELFDEARAIGVALIACQSGLALCSLGADALGEGVAIGGLVSLLADGADDQLLMI